MAEIFYTAFQSKQIDRKLNLSPTCFPNPKLIEFSFKSSEKEYYLKELNCQSGKDPYNVFSLFMNRMI